MRIIYSPKAAIELHHVHSYLVDNFGVRIANKKIDELTYHIRLLASSPQIGRLVRNGYRKTVQGQNVVLYEIRGEIIEIHHIVNSRTDWVNIILNDENFENFFEKT